jgi:hypothetical protein
LFFEAETIADAPASSDFMTAHRAPVPEEEPIPGEEPAPDQEELPPHPDPSGKGA